MAARARWSAASRREIRASENPTRRGSNASKAVNLEKFPGMLASIPAYLDIGGSLEGRLSSLDIPTLIVHGDADTTIPVGCAHTLYEMISDAQIEIVPGAVHGLMANEPELVRKMIVDFIEKAPVRT